MNNGKFSVSTNQHMHLVDITSEVQKKVTAAGITNGICYLFNPHTTAGLTINEGADPDVRTDLVNGLKEIVPLQYPFKHMEGNSPSHIMSSLMGASLTIMISNNRLQLGTWQTIYFCEFDGPRSRSVHWRLLTTD
ncbi:MAG: secondary thiamine-phosphate synthase enzyme YjbQ [Desulfocapsa sp.]|nr:secondary thiamine-phosphate synthase enzyme YjbQ [Desulfocapsa sp.]